MNTPRNANAAPASAGEGAPTARMTAKAAAAANSIAAAPSIIASIRSVVRKSMTAEHNGQTLPVG